MQLKLIEEGAFHFSVIYLERIISTRIYIGIALLVADLVLLMGRGVRLCSLLSVAESIRG